jgi:hypothetical protein
MGYKPRNMRRHQNQVATAMLVTPVRRSPPHRHAPSTRSDCVTGLPLRDNLPTIVIRDYNEQRPKGNRPCIPLRIHRHEPDGILGGCQWTGAMLRYIGEETVLAVSEPNRLWNEWWTHPNTERELYAYFDADAVCAILAIFREGADWDTQAERIGKPLAWLSKMCNRMERHMKRAMLLSA